MNIYQDKLLESIDLLISEKLKGLEFNRTISAKISEVITSSDYNIIYQNETYTAKAINNQTYTIGTLVYVLIPNNDFSKKIILSKIPQGSEEA